MPGELGAVVEGDTLAPLGWEGGQDGSHCLGDGVSGVLGPLARGPALGDEGGGAATPASPVAPFELGPGEVATPGVFLLTGQLGVDEAVNGLVGADLAGRPPALGTRPE